MSGEMRDAEERLVQHWIRPALGSQVVVEFGGAGPGSGGALHAVRVRLLDLVPGPAPQGRQEPVAQLQARYVVTVTGTNGVGPRAALAELAFAALFSGVVELERATGPLEYWSALSIPPQPCLLVRITLQRGPSSAAVADGGQG